MHKCQSQSRIRVKKADLHGQWFHSCLSTVVLMLNRLLAREIYSGRLLRRVLNTAIGGSMTSLLHGFSTPSRKLDTNSEFRRAAVPNMNASERHRSLATSPPSYLNHIYPS